MCIDNNDFSPSRCPESAAEEDISIVALLAPISSKQMHLSLFTISPTLPLTTHWRQVINTEEEQFIFIACNHSKHPHGLSVPLRQVGRSQIISPPVAEVHNFTWVIPWVRNYVKFTMWVLSVFLLMPPTVCGIHHLNSRWSVIQISVFVWYDGFY